MASKVYVNPRVLGQVRESARVRGVSQTRYIEQALLESMERDLDRMYTPSPDCWFCADVGFFMGHRCTVCAT